MSFRSNLISLVLPAGTAVAGEIPAPARREVPAILTETLQKAAVRAFHTGEGLDTWYRQVALVIGVIAIVGSFAMASQRRRRRMP